jgi:putative effector of murein hydrolase
MKVERTMITVYLSARTLAAARDVDPSVSPAAVHAAVEVAVAEQLREVAGWPPEAIRARAASLERGAGPEVR